jgi:hypothetical protein
MDFNVANFMAFTGASSPLGGGRRPAAGGRDDGDDDDDDDELEYASAAVARPSFFETLSANLKKATESDDAKFARWKKQENERQLAARTPEEKRNIGIVKLIMDSKI